LCCAFNEISELHKGHHGGHSIKWIFHGKQYKFETEKGDEVEIQAEYLRQSGSSDKASPSSSPRSHGLSVSAGNSAGNSKLDVGLMVNDAEIAEEAETKRGFLAKISPKIGRNRSKSRDSTGEPPISSSASSTAKTLRASEGDSLVVEGDDRGRKKSPASLSPTLPSAAKSPKSTKSRSSSPRREKPASNYEKLTDLDDSL